MAGLSDEKLAALAEYAENPLFTPAERAALRYTEEMTLARSTFPTRCSTNSSAISIPSKSSI